jgi:hypothetical protein
MDSAEARRCAGKRARSCDHASSPTHACLYFRFCMPLFMHVSHMRQHDAACCMHAPSGGVHVPVASRRSEIIESTSLAAKDVASCTSTPFQSHACTCHANNEQLTRPCMHFLTHVSLCWPNHRGGSATVDTATRRDKTSTGALYPAAVTMNTSSMASIASDTCGFLASAACNATCPIFTLVQTDVHRDPSTTVDPLCACSAPGETVYSSQARAARGK